MHRLYILFFSFCISREGGWDGFEMGRRERERELGEEKIMRIEGRRKAGTRKGQRRYRPWFE